MHNNIKLLVAILVATGVLAGGVWWYIQNQEIIQPTVTNTQNATEKTIAATLSYQQGDVQVKGEQSDWRAIETDSVLHQGDSVKTGTNSKAIIELENGDVLRLGYSTEIFLTSLTRGEVIVTQMAGASYNRVAKNVSRVYRVTTGTTTVQALGTAFDVVKADEKLDVNVVESAVKIVTDKQQEQVAQGKTAIIDERNNEVSVEDMDKSQLNNDWYKWNKEEDSKKTDMLGVLTEYAGPELNITSPADGVKVTSGTITVSGTVDDVQAKLTLNSLALENNNGQFSKEITLTAGKNEITVTAEDINGNKTIKELKVLYQVVASATPLKLEASTENDGVHLEWNESQGASFQYYKIVRSEANANLKYPDDGYVAVKNKGQESYIDTDASADKNYYYRVCEVMAGDSVFCSNVAHMKGKKVAEDTTNTNTDNDDEVGITLAAEAKTDGVHLSWEVNGLTIDSGFKVVKSESVNPVYPGNDYQYLTDSSVRSYTWAITDGKTYYFRVCQYNGNGKCLAYSNNTKVTTKIVATQYSGPDLSAKAEDSGVGLWWSDTSSIPSFNYYKVVRSETNASLKYPDDGYIAVKEKGVNSYRDYSAVKGKSYYYRICAVGNEVYCGNVERVTAINENETPEKVSLHGTYSAGEITLTWTASTERDFKYYKIVWSQTKTSPAYPADGYISVIDGSATVSYTDTGAKTGTRSSVVNLAEGTHYYSVCVVDQSNQVACSDTVVLISGAVQ